MLPDKPHEFRKRDPRVARSRRSERKVARKFGGQPRAGSGRVEGYKGDVMTDKYLIEDKYTDGKTFLVTRRLLGKIYYEALPENRIPMLTILFRREGKRFYLVPLADEDGKDLAYHKCGSLALSLRLFDRPTLVEFEWSGFENLWVLREL